jgi:GNAT superfamily N-acetyltransferase
MDVFERERPPYTISTDQRRLDLDAIHAFLAHESYWARGIAKDVLARAAANSLCFGVYRAGEQVGFARVISDYATYAYLNDIYILAPHRGQGLAGWLLGSVLEHPDLQGLTRFMLTTKDAQSLYARFGFMSLVFPVRHMERLAPEFLAQMRAGLSSEHS